LIQALFRIVDPCIGQVLIDGTDIWTIDCMTFGQDWASFHKILYVWGDPANQYWSPWEVQWWANLVGILQFALTVPFRTYSIFKKNIVLFWTIWWLKHSMDVFSRRWIPVILETKLERMHLSLTRQVLTAISLVLST
jgi:hypothetical protein